MATAGWLNAGKLLPPNSSAYENKVTAIETLGIICDATEEHANARGAFSCSADIVGTCEMEDTAEWTGAEKLR